MPLQVLLTCESLLAVVTMYPSTFHGLVCVGLGVHLQVVPSCESLLAFVAFIYSIQVLFLHAANLLLASLALYGVTAALAPMALLSVLVLVL